MEGLGSVGNTDASTANPPGVPEAAPKHRKYKRTRKPRRRSEAVHVLASARSHQPVTAPRAHQDRIVIPQGLQDQWTRLEQKVYEAQLLVDKLCLVDFRHDYGGAPVQGQPVAAAAALMARSNPPLATPTRPGAVLQGVRPAPATEAARGAGPWPTSNLRVTYTPTHHQHNPPAPHHQHQPPAQPRVHGSGALTHRELRYTPVAPLPITQHVFRPAGAAPAAMVASPGWATARGPRPTHMADVSLHAAAAALPDRPPLTARPSYRSTTCTPVRPTDASLQQLSREAAAAAAAASGAPAGAPGACQQWVAAPGTAPPGAPFSPLRSAAAQSGSPAAPRYTVAAATPRSRPASAATATGVMPPGGHRDGYDGMAAKAAATMALRLPTDKAPRCAGSEEVGACGGTAGACGEQQQPPVGRAPVPHLELGGVRRGGAGPRAGPVVPQLRLGGIPR